MDWAFALLLGGLVYSVESFLNKAYPVDGEKAFCAILLLFVPKIGRKGHQGFVASDVKAFDGNFFFCFCFCFWFLVCVFYDFRLFNSCIYVDAQRSTQLSSVG